jgi:hypothetical protein
MRSGKFRKINFFAGINSPYSDYGSAYYNNTLLLPAVLNTGGVARKCSSGTMNLLPICTAPPG